MGWSGIEAIGDDEKAWLIEPTSRNSWLFKPVCRKRHTVDGVDRHWSQGEDWSEKIAGELGRLLGLPCAGIELATWGADRGCISRNLVPKRLGDAARLGAFLIGDPGQITQVTGQARRWQPARRARTTRLRTR